jgi:Pentapeptide repeats (8 copies)
MSTTDSTANTPEDSPPRFEIKSVGGRVLYVARASSVKAALTEAIAAKADLRGSNLRGSNLSGSNLSYSDLRGSDLRGSDLILSVTGLPSGHAILTPTPDGWHLRVGCWTGTTTELRTLIAANAGWPEAEGDQIVERRPMLAALADMADAWTTTRQADLDAIVAKWHATEAAANV